MKILSQHYPDSSALSKTIYYLLIDEDAVNTEGVIAFEESISEINVTETVEEILRESFDDKSFSLEGAEYPDVILNTDSQFVQFNFHYNDNVLYYRLERTSLWKNK